MVVWESVRSGKFRRSLEDKMGILWGKKFGGDNFSYGGIFSGGVEKS